MNSIRYDRQMRLFKEKGQEKLLKSRVALIGRKMLSDFILTDLLSIGVGEITRLGRSDFFNFEKINPEVFLEQVEEEISSTQIAEIYLENKDFVIDATNNPFSKMFSSTVAKERGMPYFSVSAGESNFSMSSTRAGQSLMHFHEKDNYQKQGVLNSIVCSAILTDELRKRIVPIKEDFQLKEFTYSGIKESCLEKKVIQIGAGAIGTFSALALSLMNAELTVVDFDVIEETNLNRQFLFYDSNTLNKAEVLCERLKRYSQKVKGINKKIEKNFNPKGYDFIFSCVDNNEARCYLNQVSRKYNIPLINGGSSVSAGTAMPYIPGKTACLDCQTGFKLSESLKKDKTKKRSSGECFQPSIITSNQIVGALMVSCFMKSLGGYYEKTNYSSGHGIFTQGINNLCYESCMTQVA